MGDHPSFDLTDEPWITAQDTGHVARDRSLREIFAQAPALRFIGGDIPTQSFAVTRVLLAVLRRAIDWGDEPVGRWAQIWRDGRLPVDEIDDYLRRVADRFDLLDGTAPFYQVADLATAKKELRPVEVIIADLPTGSKYFTTRAGSGAASLSYAEAARWLVHCQCYDVSGIKSADPRDPRGRGGKGYPMGIGWAGQLGGVVFEGANVFETLMLNTVLSDADEGRLSADDLPVWERAHPDHREREVLTPTGTADVLTWQSRRIRLGEREGRITGVLVANGDPLESHNRWNTEFMTGWRYSETQSKKFGDNRHLPAQWNPERALWRGIEGLLDVAPSDDHKRGKPSGTARWISHLLDEGVVDSDAEIRPHAYGFTYTSQASVIGGATDDALLMRIALLGRHSEARSIAVHAVDSAADAVRALGTLASRLARAAGGTGDADRHAAESTAYFALDAAFRMWLRNVEEADDGADQLAQWQRTAHRIVRTEGRRLVTEAGEPAWKGRQLDREWMGTAVAESLFLGSLRKALPYAYPSQTLTGSGQST